MASVANLHWEPPKQWYRISTIDMHTGGEPLRVIVSGLPPIQGSTVLEKRRYFRDHYDYLRTGLMWEPRGHADMYGAVVTTSDTADLDVFFMHNEGYSTMCGHGIIALTKLALEADAGVAYRESAQLTINVPAGTVYARATFDGNRVQEVFFRNVPSFVYLERQSVEVPGLGRVQFDIAYGGAFYALIDASSLGLALVSDEHAKLVEYGRRIKQAIMAQVPIVHPFGSDLSFLYGTIFTGRAMGPSHHSRNVTVFADGEVDRSATGTGVSARAALLHARRELQIGEKITIESILGSTMTVCCVAGSALGPYAAVIPEVGATAHITGRSEFYFDPSDPLNSGFILR